MPTYEYRCRTCDARFEVQQSFSEDSLTRCPAAAEQSPAACVAPGEGEVRKVFSAPSITFKGDGFYKTDSRSGTRRSSNGTDAKKPATSTSGDGESAKESAGEAKESAGSGGKSESDRTPAGATSS